MTEHTPLPWATNKLTPHGDKEVFSGDVLVAETFGQDHLGPDYQPSEEEKIANAAYIVKACNAYPELVKALADLRLTARVLLQNAEGCAANHYGNDFNEFGPPGWLADNEDRIVNAERLLSTHQPPAPTSDDFVGRSTNSEPA